MRNGLTLTVGWTVAAVLVLGQSRALATETVVYNPQMTWRDSCGDDPGTEHYTLDRRDDGSLRVTVLEPNHGISLDTAVTLGIDTQRTPTLRMTYRATGLLTDKPDKSVLLFRCTPGGTLTALRQRDLQADGQVHTATINLRELVDEHAAGAVLNALDLRIYAGAAGEGVFDLIDLRVEGEGEPADAPWVPVRVKVVDAANQPIAGATVTLDPHLREGSATATTDELGIAVLTPDATSPGSRRAASAEKEGMTRIEFCDLSKVSGDTQLLAMLRPTHTFGGVVLDEQGQPIAGAWGDVEIRNVSQPTERPGRPTWRYPRRVVTDEHGRWTSPPLPQVEHLSLRVRWMDDRYLVDQWGGQYSGDLTEELLSKGEAVSVLRRGVAFTGTVTDEAGQPIAGAHVAQGESLGVSNPPPYTWTDEQGRYAFTNTPPGSLVMTVTAKGYAPQLVKSEAKPDMAAIDVKLTEPGVFRIRVVDSKGAPIAGASLHTEEWRGFRTLSTSFKTDSTGNATWEGPVDPVSFDVYAEGKMRESRVAIAPSAGSDDVKVVTLLAPQRITATVTDARTGEPIPSFTGVSGIMWRLGEEPTWERGTGDGEVPGNDGKWVHTYTYPYPFRVLRIEAEGYAPVVSDPFAKDAGDQDFTFALQPAESLAGTLVDATGALVPGVTVFLAAGRSMPHFHSGKIERADGCIQTQTDDAGKFTFPPQVGSYVLVAATDAGCLEMNADEFAQAEGVAAMTPWATLTGRAMIGDKPAVGAQLVVFTNGNYKPNAPRPHHDISFTADDHGYFTFNRVPAGDGRIGLMYEPMPHARGMAVSRSYTAQPGETVEVMIGGTGRPVVGRVVWPPDAEPVALTYASNMLSTKRERMPVGLKEILPEGFESWDAAKKQAFMASDEGKRLQAKIQVYTMKDNASRVYYGFKLNDDGSFRVENVEPGAYDLRVTVQAPPAAGNYPIGQPAADYQGTVEVPALPEGVAYLPDPLDVGELTLRVAKPPVKVGDEAPAFELPLLVKLDGTVDEQQKEKLALSSLRGRLVVLCFWSTQAGGAAGVPELWTVWRQHHDDARFVMLGVAASFDAEQALRHIKDHAVNWPQVYLSPQSAMNVISAYNSQRLPSIWVIDAAGKVLARDVEAKELAQTVDAALAKMPAAE